MTELLMSDPAVGKAVYLESMRQLCNLELIASENYVSAAVREAQGSILTNKYAEGYVGKRYYGGCEYVDTVEQLAIDRAQRLFQAEYVNVQPHSGSQANMAAYFTAAPLGATVLGMDLTHGGHLTHGSSVNFSGKFYKSVSYGVDRETETIDYAIVKKLAEEHRPALIIAGASAYSRIIDFEKFREIADSVEATFMVDMAHIAGLVAAGCHPSPIQHAHITTSTTHKTLRGPRGGIILSTTKFAKRLNSQIFPGIQGGPLMHVIAAKAVALHEALQTSFVNYQKQVLLNASTLARHLADAGFRIVSGGTDTHLFLINLGNRNITGKEAESTLDRAGITVNKNTVPFEELSPHISSGIRIGTPALTTRGMKETDMARLADFINEAIECKENESRLTDLRNRVKQFALTFPYFAWQQ